jgi:hypothetical protein
VADGGGNKTEILAALQITSQLTNQ